MLDFQHNAIAQRGLAQRVPRAALGLLAGGALILQPAFAVEMEEIMITASKRGEQALQEVPIAVQAVTGDQIRRQVALELIDLAPRISSLVVRNSRAAITVFTQTIFGTWSGKLCGSQSRDKVSAANSARFFHRFEDRIQAGEATRDAFAGDQFASDYSVPFNQLGRQRCLPPGR